MIINILLKNNSKNTKKLDNQDEKTYTLENDKIKLIFTNKGGEIKSAIIKGFYTYDEYKKKEEERKDIEIFNNQDSKFKVSYFTDIRKVSTDEFFTTQKNLDGKSITFRKDYKNGAFIEYTYTLNDEEENFVDLTINTEGISNPELVWTIAAPETEKSKINQKQWLKKLVKLSNYRSEEAQQIRHHQ